MRKCEECGMDDTSQVRQFDLDMSDICIQCISLTQMASFWCITGQNRICAGIL